jgi:cytochrome c5
MGARNKESGLQAMKGLVLVGLMVLVCSLAFAELSGSLDEKEIIERLKPIGEVTVEGGAAKQETVTVMVDAIQQRYEQSCKMCHETGIAESPKFGNKKDWASRIAQGMDILVKHALEGYKAMPAKGGCSTCSDEEIKKTVEYMVSKSK